MFESGKKGHAAKKAYEIAYALFRISAKISESSIKEKLELQAIDLLISTNAEEYGNAAKAVAAIDALVKFAVDLNMMSISNGDILLREIAAMNEIVFECIDKSDEIDVSKFFSPSAVPAKAGTQDIFVSGKNNVKRNVVPARARIQEQRTSVIPAEAMSSRVATRDPGFLSPDPISERNDTSAVLAKTVAQEKSFFSVVPAEAETQVSFSNDDEKVSSTNPATAIKSGNRQIAILDRIRQSGNCKLREIQEILPDCSERTIRYDLEELIERNLVERIGAGGPAVSYKIRQFV
jgi:hypothetical protein